MPAKWKTVAFDSASELSRLFFSRTLGKSSADEDKIRNMKNYPDVTERLNMIIRRLKNLRDAGTEVVFTAHEDLQKVYARGGAMGGKDGASQEPIAIKGWPDMPGNRTPDEMCRAADNVLRIKTLNRVPMAVAAREPIGGGGDYWETKDRFGARTLGTPPGYFPLDYRGISSIAIAGAPKLWRPPYIWIFYGPFGIGKTRSLLTFPRPLKLFDMDRGTKSIEPDVEDIRAKEGANAFVIESYDVEDQKSYEPFMASVGALF